MNIKVGKTAISNLHWKSLWISSIKTLIIMARVGCVGNSKPRVFKTCPDSGDYINIVNVTVVFVINRDVCKLICRIKGFGRG